METEPQTHFIPLPAPQQKTFSTDSPTAPTAPPEDLFDWGQEHDYAYYAQGHPTPHTTTTPFDLPPSYSTCGVTTPHPHPPKEPFPTTEQEVRSILSGHFHTDPSTSWLSFLTGSKTKSVESMKITRLVPMNAFSYTLNTFTERRTVVDNCEPYRNQYVDGKENGPIWNKWDVVFNPPISFARAKCVKPLPHSCSVLDCPACAGKGKITCRYCDGVPSKPCAACSGSGWTKNIEGTTFPCQSCGSLGKRRCQSCTTGYFECLRCKGHKSLFYYQDVQTNWDCSETKHFTRREELLTKHLSEAKGWTRFERSSSGFKPLGWRKDPEIVKKAEAMLKCELKKQDENFKVLNVKESVEEIPVIKVNYTWEGEVGHCFIFSTDCKVYFPPTFLGYFNPRNCAIV